MHAQLINMDLQEGMVIKGIKYMDFQMSQVNPLIMILSIN
jgi:hypothetical protein